MTVQCELCPKSCLIPPGQSGECRIRVNIDGRLTAVTYGYPSAVHVDPIEKKPLNHFLPGSATFSLATVGCNLHCKNCQNWQISQANPEDATASQVPPDRVPLLAKQYNCQSVAYTYTDPVVYYEYTLDSCRKVREAGLKNVLVTAGYINERPLRELCRFVDAITLDVKALSDRFYREICDATLAPVLHTLVTAKAMGVMLEVSHLIIPTLNDTDTDLRALCRWVKENLGPETPLHFLRFFPHHQMQHLPPTPAETMARAREIARAGGMYHVYAGNIMAADAGKTSCHACGRLLIERVGTRVTQNNLIDGNCPGCKTPLYGVWK